MIKYTPRLKETRKKRKKNWLRTFNLLILRQKLELRKPSNCRDSNSRPRGFEMRVLPLYLGHYQHRITVPGLMWLTDRLKMVLLIGLKPRISGVGTVTQPLTLLQKNLCTRLKKFTGLQFFIESSPFITFTEFRSCLKHFLNVLGVEKLNVFFPERHSRSWRRDKSSRNRSVWMHQNTFDLLKLSNVVGTAGLGSNLVALSPSDSWLLKTGQPNSCTREPVLASMFDNIRAMSSLGKFLNCFFWKLVWLKLIVKIDQITGMWVETPARNLEVLGSIPATNNLFQENLPF